MKRKNATWTGNTTVSKSASGFVEGYWSSSGYIQPVIIHVDDSEAYDLYKENEWLFAVINRIVADCTQVDMKLVPKDPNQKSTDKFRNRLKSVADFFEDPNENKESFKELREKFIRDLLVYGRGTMEKVKKNERLLYLYSLVSKNITIRTDEFGNLRAWKTYKQENPHNVSKPTYFNKDEVIFSVLHPASHTLYGIKPIDILANAVATDLLRAAYNSNLFVNGAEAAGILSIPGMTRTELKRFRQFWESRFKGASNSHRTFIVNSKDTSWVRMALSNADMQFGEYGVELRSKIFAAYNMQPFVMGILDQTVGKLNSEQQITIYKNGALKPILSKEQYVYTNEIIRDGLGIGDVNASFSEIDLADKQTEATIDNERIANGTMVINEYRAKRGERPVKWGDTPIQMSPGGGQVDPNTGRVIPPNQQAGGAGGNQQKPPAKPAQKADDDDSIYKPVFPTKMNVMEKFFNHYKNTCTVQPYIWTGDVLQRLFQERKQYALAKMFVMTTKLYTKQFDGKSSEAKREIDILIRDIKRSEVWYDLYLGEGDE